jgi:hypothetical protein
MTDMKINAKPIPDEVEDWPTYLKQTQSLMTIFRTGLFELRPENWDENGAVALKVPLSVDLALRNPRSQFGPGARYHWITKHDYDTINTMLFVFMTNGRDNEHWIQAGVNANDGHGLFKTMKSYLGSWQDQLASYLSKFEKCGNSQNDVVDATNYNDFFHQLMKLFTNMNDVEELPAADKMSTNTLRSIYVNRIRTNFKEVANYADRNTDVAVMAVNPRDPSLHKMIMKENIHANMKDDRTTNDGADEPTSMAVFDDDWYSYHGDPNISMWGTSGYNGDWYGSRGWSSYDAYKRNRMYNQDQKGKGKGKGFSKGKGKGSYGKGSYGKGKGKGKGSYNGKGKGKGNFLNFMVAVDAATNEEYWSDNLNQYTPSTGLSYVDADGSSWVLANSATIDSNQGKYGDGSSHKDQKSEEDARKAGQSQTDQSKESFEQWNTRLTWAGIDVTSLGFSAVSDFRAAIGADNLMNIDSGCNCRLVVYDPRYMQPVNDAKPCKDHMLGVTGRGKPELEGTGTIYIKTNDGPNDQQSNYRRIDVAHSKVQPSAPAHVMGLDTVEYDANGHLTGNKVDFSAGLIKLADGSEWPIPRHPGVKLHFARILCHEEYMALGKENDTTGADAESWNEGESRKLDDASAFLVTSAPSCF